MSAGPRWKWPVLLSLLAGAAALALWGDKQPAGLAQPTRQLDAGVPTRAVPRAAAAAAGAATAPATTLALLLPRSSRPAPPGNPFAVVPDVPAPQARAVVALAPSAPPPPERPPYVYQGKQRTGAAWQLFLVRDEQVHIAQVGSVLDRRWRVELIQPPTLTLVDLDTQQRFSIPIGDSP